MRCCALLFRNAAHVGASATGCVTEQSRCAAGSRRLPAAACHKANRQLTRRAPGAAAPDASGGHGRRTYTRHVRRFRRRGRHGTLRRSQQQRASCHTAYAPLISRNSQRVPARRRRQSAATAPSAARRRWQRWAAPQPSTLWSTCRATSHSRCPRTWTPWCARCRLRRRSACTPLRRCR